MTGQPATAPEGASGPRRPAALGDGDAPYLDDLLDQLEAAARRVAELELGRS